MAADAETNTGTENANANVADGADEGDDTATKLYGDNNDGNEDTDADKGEGDKGEGKGTESSETGEADADKSDSDKATDKDSDKAKDSDKEKDKEDDGKEKLEGAPEKYEAFKLPDGYKLNDETLDKFTNLAKEMNLPQAQAQKFLDLASTQVVDLVANQEIAFKAERDKWVQELKSDKEFGGAKFDTTVEQANKAFARFGTPELIKFLDKGYGDNPELIKAFARINAAISEDTVVGGTPPKDAPKSIAERLYG